MAALSEKDLGRYQRQILVSGFGVHAQKKLKNAHVLVAGAGGLGSTVLSYLAVSGIGSITFVDHDKVELSNLNRQILHWDKDISKTKVESALEKLMMLNPDVKIKGICEKISADNVMDFAKGKDGIVDCMDNFTTRYLLNDAALKVGIPLFHGACYGFEGRVSTIIPKKTPCLRCIVPVNPKEGACPGIGSVVGIIGAIQATEVIKYFGNVGELLSGKLFVFDSLYMRCASVDVERNPKCPSCGSVKGGI
ncbi:MAG: HesA/MoeB/ThiF family protein [archaeon]